MRSNRGADLVNIIRIWFDAVAAELLRKASVYNLEGKETDRENG